MTAVEIIAWIMIFVAIVKMIAIVVNPKAWLNFAKKTWSNKSLIQVVCLVLAAIVLYSLLQELTIVQIFATMGFAALLLAVGLASELNSLLKKYEIQIKKGKLWKDYWFYALLWVILIIWTLTELIK